MKTKDWLNEYKSILHVNEVIRALQKHLEPNEKKEHVCVCNQSQLKIKKRVKVRKERENDSKRRATTHAVPTISRFNVIRIHMH